MTALQCNMNVFCFVHFDQSTKRIHIVTCAWYFRISICKKKKKKNLHT